METYKAFAGKQTNLNHIIQIAFNLALWYNFVEWIQCCILRVLIYFLKHMSDVFRASLDNLSENRW